MFFTPAGRHDNYKSRAPKNRKFGPPWAVAKLLLLHKSYSPVLAPFFLRSSLRSGRLGPAREKMGPSPPERSEVRRKNGARTGLCKSKNCVGLRGDWQLVALTRLFLSSKNKKKKTLMNP